MLTNQIPIVTALGRGVLIITQVIGRLVAFVGTSLHHTVTPPFYLRLVIKQMRDIGFYSLPVVGLTALFTGMVLA